MVTDKSLLTDKKKKTIFVRLSNKFTNQQRCSKRDQSVQTNHHPSTATDHSKQQIFSSVQSSTHRYRSSLKSFLTLNSPKSISLIHRVRRRSINLKTSKRLSSECLQVALIRKIQPVNQFDSYKQIVHDETTNRDAIFPIGPMKWSTPNRTIVYKTSSPCNDNIDQQSRLCAVDQLSFSNIFDLSD